MTDSQQFELDGPVTVEIRIAKGDIVLSTADVDHARVQLSGPERLIQATSVELHGTTLEIKQRQRGLLGLLSSGDPRAIVDGSVDVEILVPDGSSTDIVTASSDIELRGEFIEVGAKGASGDVEIRGEVFGDVTIKNVSGDVEIQHVGGDVRCQTVSGDVTVGTVDGSASVTSVSGDIELRSLCGGTVNVNSVSGDIELGIARGTGLEVDATSTSGDMSSDVPLDDAPIEEGDGAVVVVRARTVSGDVHIMRAPEREGRSA
jgi:hypothetical protein